MDLRVGRKFRLGRKIGQGSFGDIYLGVNVPTGEEVAIKLELLKTRHPQLGYESKIYRVLNGGIGIPTTRWFGVEGSYSVLVMDLLGPSLEDLFNYCGRKFSVKTVCMLADQLISRVEYIHTKNFLHRDIKPDNFLIGQGRRNNVVYAIDFGLAKRYRNPRTHTHIRYREHKHLTGTPRYASVNNHLGIEQSRRDDLESLGYVLMYFLRGSLPWQGLRANTKKQKYQKILEKKMSTPFKLLTKGFPREFCGYLEYCRTLRFDDKPNYSYLKKLFRDVMAREALKDDNEFDWVKRKRAESSKKAGGGGDAAGTGAAAGGGGGTGEEAAGAPSGGGGKGAAPDGRAARRVTRESSSSRRDVRGSGDVGGRRGTRDSRAGTRGVSRSSGAALRRSSSRQLPGSRQAATSGGGGGRSRGGVGSMRRHPDLRGGGTAGDSRRRTASGSGRR